MAVRFLISIGPGWLRWRVVFDGNLDISALCISLYPALLQPYGAYEMQQISTYTTWYRSLCAVWYELMMRFLATVIDVRVVIYLILGCSYVSVCISFLEFRIASMQVLDISWAAAYSQGAEGAFGPSSSKLLFTFRHCGVICAQYVTMYPWYHAVVKNDNCFFPFSSM